MSENTYGYADDASEQGGGMVFGLNAGVTKMVKFEFNANGGKDGAAQEALDIVFNISGKDVSYRMFPVTKTYGDNNEEITDIAHPAMQKAIKEFNAVIVHILHTFVPKETIKTALSVPINGFKQFCNIAANILPKDFANMPVDIFAQWQWQITGDNTKTYLRLPKNMKHGKWLAKHIAPIGGEWKEMKLNGSLSYQDSNGTKHPFTRTKWFMSSNFAAQQSDEEEVNIDSSSQATSTQDWE
jgi:hypothetical protein